MSSSIKASENPGPIETAIIDKIKGRFDPAFFKIANDSHKHSHHQGMVGASNVKESHFRVEIVSEAFGGLSMPSRHRLVYQLLDDEFKNHGLHALQMKTKTPEEVKK